MEGEGMGVVSGGSRDGCGEWRGGCGEWRVW